MGRLVETALQLQSWSIINGGIQFRGIPCEYLFRKEQTLINMVTELISMNITSTNTIFKHIIAREMVSAADKKGNTLYKYVLVHEPSYYLAEPAAQTVDSIIATAHLPQRDHDHDSDTSSSSGDSFALSSGEESKRRRHLIVPVDSSDYDMSVGEDDETSEEDDDVSLMIDGTAPPKLNTRHVVPKAPEIVDRLLSNLLSHHVITSHAHT